MSIYIAIVLAIVLAIHLHVKGASTHYQFFDIFFCFDKKMDLPAY